MNDDAEDRSVPTAGVFAGAPLFKGLDARVELIEISNRIISGLLLFRTHGSS
jgi:hypothetical protein